MVTKRDNAHTGATRHDTAPTWLREFPASTAGQWLLNRTRLIGLLFSLAIVTSPFFALLYGFTAALATMTFALAATAYLTADAARNTAPLLRRRLFIASAVNGALALACAAMLAGRVI